MLRVSIRSVPAMLLVLSFSLAGCPGGENQDPLPSCETTECGQNASCADMIDGPVCSCNTGYMGDGQTCCADLDIDDVCDDVDNCPDTSNSLQEDTDQDGIGDACDFMGIAIPLEDLTTTAQFYSFETEAAPNTVVHYFAVLDAGGAPHVAFDACDVCYASRLGYSQSGTKMVCNNCSNEFEISGIGTENLGGGCWPGHLPIDVTETEIHIETADLDDGAWYWE